MQWALHYISYSCHLGHALMHFRKQHGFQPHYQVCGQRTQCGSPLPSPYRVRRGNFRLDIESQWSFSLTKQGDSLQQPPSLRKPLDIRHTIFYRISSLGLSWIIRYKTEGLASAQIPFEDGHSQMLAHNLNRVFLATHPICPLQNRVIHKRTHPHLRRQLEICTQSTLMA